MVQICGKLSDHQQVVELLLQLSSTVSVRGEWSGSTQSHGDCPHLAKPSGWNSNTWSLWNVRIL